MEIKYINGVLLKDTGLTTPEKTTYIQTVRNHLLSITDWTQLPDVVLTETERTAWQDYRQALRDIPQTYSNPDDVIFPVPPIEVQ